jgi:hypothetical protein
MASSLVSARRCPHEEPSRPPMTGTWRPAREEKDAAAMSGYELAEMRIPAVGMFRC